MDGKPHGERESDNPGVRIGTWLLVLAPIVWTVALIKTIGFAELATMKLSGWIILSLSVALVLAVMAFIVRCVRLYLRWNRVPSDED